MPPQEMSGKQGSERPQAARDQGEAIFGNGKRAGSFNRRETHQAWEPQAAGVEHGLHPIGRGMIGMGHARHGVPPAAPRHSVGRNVQEAQRQ